ncbi:MAG: chromate transporter, partial [Xanthomonadales bacterium PRO6]|nr:chromate transporter [Xanthomonadales bacterium PRO6]
MATAFLAIHALGVPLPAIVLFAAVAGLALARWHPKALPEDAAAAAAASDRDCLIDVRIAAVLCPHTRPSVRRAFAHLLAWGVLWWLPVLAAFALLREHVLAQQGVFFSQAALVIFGGAYAVLAYVAQRAVEDLDWLRPGEMADDLALAETTPGPLIERIVTLSRPRLKNTWALDNARCGPRLACTRSAKPSMPRRKST